MIIKPFNGAFFLVLAVAVAAILIIREIFKNSSYRAKSIFIVSACAFNIAVFFIYKGFLSCDSQFVEISGISNFNWFDELPLHLCNINMFLIPIGVLTKNRSILGFSHMLAPLGALMALIFPGEAFSGYSLFMPRMLGFYITHTIILICGVSLFTLGFYRPDFRDFPGITAAFFITAFGAHLLNTLLRHTVCPFANYFFTYGADISILNLCWKFIPIPFLYEIPLLTILFAYMGLVCLVCRINDKIGVKLRNRRIAVNR